MRGNLLGPRVHEGDTGTDACAYGVTYSNANCRAYSCTNGGADCGAHCGTDSRANG